MINVIGEARDGYESVRLVKAFLPEVLVIDVHACNGWTRSRPIFSKQKWVIGSLWARIKLDKCNLPLNKGETS